MECSSADSFEELIKISETSSLDKIFDSYQNNQYAEELFNNSGKKIGLIYNLDIKEKKINIGHNNDNNDVKFKQKQNNNNLIGDNNNNSNVSNFNSGNQISTSNSSSYIDRRHNLKIKLKEEFKSPPLTGLKNIGATCYMNATLQCLSQIEKLTSYFKYNDKIEYIIAKNETGLTKSYKVLIENLWPSVYNSNYLDPDYIGHNGGNNYFIPEKKKKKISSMNPLFKGIQANDAKDLVNFIIMTLHEELNKKNNYKNNFVPNFNIDQTNQNEVLAYFIENFKREHKSIISDLFYGVTHTVTNCLNCNIFKHNYEAIFFLIFPLEEVRNYKLQLTINQNNIMLANQNQMDINQNYMNNQLFQQNLTKIKLLQNNYVNIFDCFEYYQKIENFSGDNSMYCNICRMQWPSNYATFLYSAPNILILVLNRGKGIQFNVKLEFYTELNLTYFVEARQNNEIIIYDLIGVVTHMGESGASGHFIANCKSPIDGLWYQYNDDLVSRIQDFNSQILNYAMPYILFYQKRA